MYDVVTFGSATLDVFLRSSAMEVDAVNGEKEICVRYGAKLEVDEIYFETGGGGTNTAFTFARQGLKAACLVQVGDDFAGRRVIEDLQKESVATQLVAVQKETITDYSTILWAGDGGRTVLVYRGRTRLEVVDVPWAEFDSNWFYVASLEGNLAIMEEIQNRYPQRQIAWNPGSRELQQREKLVGLLAQVTVLNLNREEMAELLQIEPSQQVESLLTLAQQLPCRYVVITDDCRGSYLWDAGRRTWWQSGIFTDSSRFETTGAGDAFGSGLVAGLIKEKSLTESLYLAAANASSVVAQVGAKKGILKERDLLYWPREKLHIKEYYS